MSKTGTQGRPADSDRVLRLLQQTSGLSNPAIRTELNLADTRYQEIRQSLIQEGLVEAYRCRGGGIRLTTRGESSVPTDENAPQSTVKAEKNLYQPLIKLLEQQSTEDDTSSIVVNTADLRKKGTWQNPDVTQVMIERYPYLRRTEIIVQTFEVKQWGRWDINVVFESASHKRFSHEAAIVLEWPNGVDFSLSDPTYKLDEIARECRRFGVGLYTLRPYYSAYRLYTHIETPRHIPLDADVESWLEYLFTRRPAALQKFEQLQERNT